MEEISRGDFKQGEVYMAINPQLKNHSQAQALSFSLLPIASHCPPTDESCGRALCQPEEQAGMSGERLIENWERGGCSR